MVDAASLAAWCEVHLGSPAESELFRTGHLACVIGTRLADGREVVVKVRPDAARIAACTQVQHRLWRCGYPCPRPLAGPAPLGEHAATAESYDPSMGHRISYGGTTKINRKNFGLSFNAILDGRMVVSEEIQITIEGELVEQPQAAGAAGS